MTAAFDPVKITSLRALHDWVLVAEMNFRERTTSSGIILHSDDGTTAGIRLVSYTHLTLPTKA